MTVKDLLAIALNERGFEGLYNERYGCGCLIRDELICCIDMFAEDCQPGYETDESYGCGDGPGCHCPFHVTTKKPERL